MVPNLFVVLQLILCYHIPLLHRAAQLSDGPASSAAERRARQASEETLLELESYVSKRIIFDLISYYVFVHTNIDDRIPQNGAFRQLKWKDSHVECHTLKQKK